MIHEEKALRESLIDLAYRYYPYDIADNDETYYRSKEHLYLKEARTNMATVSTQWDLLLSRIKEQYQVDNYSIQDWRETATVDRCLVGRLLINHTGQDIPSCLVFNISFVAPVYIVYEAYNRKRDFLILPSLEPIYIEINRLIKELFPEYTEMPASLASVELDNIVFDGLGVLSTWQSDILRKMTLFNAFFSNSYY